MAELKIRDIVYVKHYASPILPDHYIPATWNECVKHSKKSFEAVLIKLKEFYTYKHELQKIIVLKDHGLYNIGMEYTHNFVDALYETISKEKHFSKVTVTSGTLCGSSKTAAEKIQRIFPDYTEREFEENILELSTSETIPPLMVNVDDTRRVFLIYTLETQNTS